MGSPQEWTTFAGRIELDRERREMPGIEFAIQDVLTIEKEHGVLRVDAVAPKPPVTQVQEGLRKVTSTS